MKTKSIQSLATLFTVAVVLQVSAFAGPGPQTTPVFRKASPVQKVAVQKTASVGKAVVKTNAAPQVIYETGAHGGTYITRR